MHSGVGEGGGGKGGFRQQQLQMIKTQFYLWVFLKTNFFLNNVNDRIIGKTKLSDKKH